MLLLLGATLDATATPCGSPHEHEFDFWAGDWTVSGGGAGELGP
jgi:hypothetical protein